MYCNNLETIEVFKMKSFSIKIFILAIICRIYLVNARRSEFASIISGTRATLGQFPWHVLLRIDETDESLLKCGGSIISDKWVLTAAHCVHNIKTLVIAFATIDFDNNPINMSCTKYFIHPAYKGNVLTDDIALVELPTALNFSDNIQAIDLVSPSEVTNDFLGAKATISGFGGTDWLLWATLEVINNSRCAEVHPVPNDNRTMCAIGWNGTNQSPCSGDSGGALVWTNEMNKPVQIGIADFAKTQCSQYPTGFTRLTTYLDYIYDITGLKFV